MTETYSGICDDCGNQASLITYYGEWICEDKHQINDV